MRQKPPVASSAKTYTPWYLAGVFYFTRTCLALSFLFATAFLVVNLPQALGVLHDALAAYGVSFFVGAFLVDAVLRPSLVFLGACLSWYVDTALKNWQDLVLHRDLLVVPKIASVSEPCTQSKGDVLSVAEILPVEKKELGGYSGAVMRHLGLSNNPPAVSQNRRIGYTSANYVRDQRRKLTSWLRGRGSTCAAGNGVPNARIWLSGVAAASSSGALGARQELDVASMHVFGDFSKVFKPFYLSRDAKTSLPFSFLFRQEQSRGQQGLVQTVSGAFALSAQVVPGQGGMSQRAPIPFVYQKKSNHPLLTLADVHGAKPQYISPVVSSSWGGDVSEVANVARLSVWKKPEKNTLEQVSVQKEGDGLGSYKYEQVNSRSDAAHGSLSGPGAMTKDSNWWVPVLAKFLTDQPLLERAPLLQGRDVAVPFRNEARMSEYLQDGDSSSARHTAQSVQYALGLVKLVESCKCVDVVDDVYPKEESLASDPFIRSVLDCVLDGPNPAEVAPYSHDNPNGEPVTSVGGQRSVDDLIKAWEKGKARGDNGAVSPVSPVSPVFFDTEEEEGMQSSNEQDGFTAHILAETTVIVPK